MCLSVCLSDSNLRRMCVKRSHSLLTHHSHTYYCDPFTVCSQYNLETCCYIGLQGNKKKNFNCIIRRLSHTHTHIVLRPDARSHGDGRSEGPSDSHCVHVECNAPGRFLHPEPAQLAWLGPVGLLLRILLRGSTHSGVHTRITVCVSPHTHTHTHTHTCMHSTCWYACNPLTDEDTHKKSDTCVR